jgi:1-acyl-sn-glycerol-3-phosphate acyltransferase
VRRLDAYPVNGLVRLLLRAACRLDAREFSKIPAEGPGLFAMNHINFLEAPLVASFLFPRRVAALSKRENLANPAYAYFASIWNAIPIDRGAVDTESFRRCLAWVAGGGLLGLAPEGTRSRTGVLGTGKAGVAVLAARADAPIWPMAHWGGEAFWTNLKRLRRTPVTVRVGRPFRIEPVGGMTKTTRQEVADEIMGRIAVLMPEKYRGPYAASCLLPPKHLKFL